MLPYSSAPTRTAPSAAVTEPPRKPWYQRPAFLLASVLGAVILAGAAFAAYYLFFRTPPANVALQISQPEKVLMGEPFALTVSYSNASSQTLQNATVSLTVPEGVSVIGVDPSVRVNQQEIGDVGPQGIGSRTFRLIVTDGAESVKRVAVSFKYHLNDNQASRFESAARADITVSAPAIALNFDVPQSVFSGQDFDIKVGYQNRSQASFTNAKLFLDYPRNFEVAAAEGPSHDGGGKEWQLGALPANAQGEVGVVGRVVGGQQTFFSVGVHMQVDVEGRTYTLGAQSATVGISAAPLSLSIAANGKKDYVAGLGEQVTYVLSYRNDSAFSLQNVVIEAKLDSPLFNISTLVSGGVLDSVKNTVTWNTANTPALAAVKPGGSGSVQLQIALVSSWPIDDVADKNFTLKVSGRIQSLTVPAGISADQALGLADLETKVRGRVELESLVYYRDPQPGIVNKGPYPPRVNQATQYTVHWRVRNFATNLENVRVAAVLQSGARMVEVVKSTAANLPVYDSQTGRVTWDLASLAANQGVFGTPVEAIFRIEATPAANQVRSDIPLMGETLLTARDAFTGSPVSIKVLAKTSALPDDGGAPGGDRRVQP